MYINPQTNIKLLKNVPLDTTYEHTIYFSSASDQSTYFASLVKYNLTNYTYQRVKRGYARIGIKADSLYDCNYMMFQNTAYGSKWFYAFITSVEYVNDECSEIAFELDVMQTWFFNCKPDYCFVEREHSKSDNVGDNILPEPVEIGEQIYSAGVNQVDNLGELCVIVESLDTTAAEFSGVIYDGIYGAGNKKAFRIDDYSGINTYLKTFAQKTDNILSIYMCPRVTISSSPLPTEGHSVDNNYDAYEKEYVAQKISGTETLNGYTPKNKKLYTFPYNMFSVIDGSGNELQLRYEFFSNGSPTLILNSTCSLPVQVMVRPKNYKGMSECYSESLTLSGFPMCSWGIDSYQAWVAQHSLPQKVQTGMGVIGSVIASVVAPPIGVAVAGMSALNAVTSSMLQKYQASVASDSVKGNQNNGGVNTAAKTNNFFCGRKCCQYQYARAIDNFFSMYGYATKRVKKPNRNSRPHWNYVKTVGCTITGSVPADDMRKICSIYDNGITFWKNGAEVGDYSLDNSPS